MDPKQLILDPREKVFSLWSEFKQFAFKGNVIDMAVGVVIGAAFAKIVESLVKNVIMPVVNLVTPESAGANYTEWTLHIGGKEVPYGHFLGDIANFLIVALALYLFIAKFLGWIMRAKKEEAVAPPPPPEEIKLLTEIRDLLKAKA